MLFVDLIYLSVVAAVLVLSAGDIVHPSRAVDFVVKSYLGSRTASIRGGYDCHTGLAYY